MEKNTTIIEALTTRRAIRAFDTTKKVSEENLKTILEAGILSPSSYGTEPWKFFVITNPEIRAQIRAVGYDQPKITDASHLIVIARMTDNNEILNTLIERTASSQNKTVEDLNEFKGMVENAFTYKGSEEGKAAWIKAQTYIALGIMMETASLLNIDNAAMEGFDASKVDEILGLGAKNLSTVTMLALGYRDETDTLTPKVRRAYSNAVEII